MLERVEPESSFTGRGLLDFGRQLSLIVAAALLYFGVRGQTEAAESLAVAHGFDLLAFERKLLLDVEVGLQQLILPYQWAVTAVNWIYIWGHWPVIAATLVWLYRTRRLDFLVLRNALFVSGAIGLVIFAVYPVAPPRLLPMGFVDTVTELSTSYRVLQPPSLVNKYAALPSLHVGWNLLVGLALFRAGTSWFVRGFGVLSPLAMVAAVVLTGNHYVVDAVLGVVVGTAGLALAYWLTPKLTMVRLTRTRDPAGSTVIERTEPLVVSRCSDRDIELMRRDRGRDGGSCQTDSRPGECLSEVTTSCRRRLAAWAGGSRGRTQRS